MSRSLLDPLLLLIPFPFTPKLLLLRLSVVHDARVLVSASHPLPLVVQFNLRPLPWFQFWVLLPVSVDFFLFFLVPWVSCLAAESIASRMYAAPTHGARPLQALFPTSSTHIQDVLYISA